MTITSKRERPSVVVVSVPATEYERETGMCIVREHDALVGLVRFARKDGGIGHMRIAMDAYDAFRIWTQEGARS